MHCGHLLICLLFSHGHHDRWFTDYSYLDDQAGYQVSGVDERHQTPTVVISNALASFDAAGQQISSSDEPGFWTEVPYGQLNLAVKVPSKSGEPVASNGVQLFLDGQPVDKSQFDGVQLADEVDARGQIVKSYSYHIDCPSPGKHILQARYLKQNVWSHLSSPLHFRMSFPQRPKIIAVADVDAGDYGGPLTRDPVKITGDQLRLKLAHVRYNDLVSIYVDGRKVSQDQRANGACCVQVDLAGSMVPGIHDLTVRSIPDGQGCSLASPPSKSVKIHYYNEDDYLLRPGYGCDAGWGHCDSDENVTGENKLPIFTSRNDSSLMKPKSTQDGVSDGSRPMVKVKVAKYHDGVFTKISQQANDSVLPYPDGIKAALNDAIKFSNDADITTTEARKLIEHIGVLESLVNKTAKEAEHISQIASNHLLQAKIAQQLAANGDQSNRSSVTAQRGLSESAVAKVAVASSSARRHANNVNNLRQAAKEHLKVAEMALIDAKSMQSRVVQLAEKRDIRNSKKAAIEVGRFSTNVRNQLAAILTSKKTIEAEVQQAILQKNNAKIHSDLAAEHVAFAERYAWASTTAVAKTTAEGRASIAKTNVSVAKSVAYHNALSARDESMAASANRFDVNLPKRDWANSEKRSFYFAAPAHFPIRGFGPQGELLDQEGAVIYEDMKFTFDENGEYKITFRASTPNLPTELRLQFQVQSRPDGPWYTLTMRDRRFEPQKDGSHGMHPQDFTGKSEILRRCFTSICDVRRSGTARFGFGIAGLGQRHGDE